MLKSVQAIFNEMKFASSNHEIWYLYIFMASDTYYL